MNKKKEKAVHW